MRKAAIQMYKAFLFSPQVPWSYSEKFIKSVLTYAVYLFIFIVFPEAAPFGPITPHNSVTGGFLLGIWSDVDGSLYAL